MQSTYDKLIYFVMKISLENFNSIVAKVNTSEIILSPVTNIYYFMLRLIFKLKLHKLIKHTK